MKTRRPFQKRFKLNHVLVLIQTFSADKWQKAYRGYCGQISFTLEIIYLFIEFYIFKVSANYWSWYLNVQRKYEAFFMTFRSRFIKVWRPGEETRCDTWLCGHASNTAESRSAVVASVFWNSPSLSHSATFSDIKIYKDLRRVHFLTCVHKQSVSFPLKMQGLSEREKTFRQT